MKLVCSRGHEFDPADVSHRVAYGDNRLVPGGRCPMVMSYDRLHGSTYCRRILKVKGKVEKVPTGFKLGTKKVTVLMAIGEVRTDAKIYRLVKVRTSDDNEYYSLRLYNARGHFIKQLMFEPDVREGLLALLQKSREFD